MKIFSKFFNGFKSDKALIIINDKTYTGNNISINGDNVIIDGVQREFKGKTIKIDIIGDVNTLNSGSGDVIVHGNANKVKSGSGDVEIFGDVFENATTGSGDIQCINIHGGVKTGSGDVSAKTINT
tara:strand:+ start:3056 stop:3433 length:378 start_codon:yes stop_codon:yes gene_type:complete